MDGVYTGQIGVVARRLGRGVEGKKEWMDGWMDLCFACAVCHEHNLLSVSVQRRDQLNYM